MRFMCVSLVLAVASCASPTAPATDAARDQAADATDVAADLAVTDSGPAATGCGTRDATPLPVGTAPGADGGSPGIQGPGGPSRTFTELQIDHACAYLDGGPTDREHHNTVLMFDGYLWMPWAHEAGGGGVSVWDFADACAPRHIATVTDARMRESHTAGFQLENGRWMVTASLGGLEFWDVSDPRRVRMVREFVLPGVRYPDAYMRVVLSTFWQAPYVYVGSADNGVFVVDARDPREPVLVRQFSPEPAFRVGGVYAIGNLLVVQSTEGSRTALMDISDPSRPRPIPGGSFLMGEGPGIGTRPVALTAYFGHVNGDRVWYARHLLGGGLITFDISDPTHPTRLSAWQYEGRANGGYVFLKEDTAFVGLSNLGVALDVSDPTQPRMVREFHLTGDLDTVVPMGNVVVLSVDDRADEGQASAVVPYQREPDRRAPRVNMVNPRDGSQALALTARVGVTFDEFIDLATVHRASFIVRPMGGGAPVEGWYSGQEGIVNFWPASPLTPDTTYEVIVPAGGVRDTSGNPTATAFRATFRTVACPTS